MTGKEREAFAIADYLIFDVLQLVGNVNASAMCDEELDPSDVKKEAMCKRYFELRGMIINYSII